MKLSHLTTSILAFGLLAGCAQAEQASQKVTTSAAEATDTIKSASNVVKTAAKSTAKTTQSGVSIHTAVPGVYKSEATHAYITFQYLHQGYARPTLRWNDFDATVNLDPSNPTASTLNVVIDTASTDSCLLYTSPSPRDATLSRMPSSA